VNSRRYIILAALFFAVETSRAANPTVYFTQGLEFQRAGQYPEAAAAFEKSATARPAAGALVNLGLAEWQRGHAGAAILAWERSQWIDPFNNRAAQNLTFARQVIQVDALQLKWFEAASTWLPPDAWVWFAGASLWLAVGMLTLPPFLRWRKTGWQQALAAIGLGIFLASMTANLGVVSRTQLGIVLKKNVPLRLTPTREGEAIATLNAGEPARRLRTRGNFYFIRTFTESGWIERSSFGLVNE